MRAFFDTTTAGNEKAIRRGVRVPDGDVNLAYVKSPALSPKNNIVIIDTSGMTPENVSENSSESHCSLYYANQFGVLGQIIGRDNDGRPIWNNLVQDERPLIGDVFSVDEDWSLKPGSEYTNDAILPLKHTSRFFHVAPAGAYPGLPWQDSKGFEKIKIVNDKGIEYPNYRIVLIPVPEWAGEEDGANPASSDVSSADAPYRIHAYTDGAATKQRLYLTYNKVELTPDGYYKNSDINWKEILNPQSYFTFVPEESDVIDPANRNQKIYSTKPINVKEQIIGVPTQGADGYKVYVPKKALPDPRLFQLFRWRARADFAERVKVDPAKPDQSLNVGMVSTQWNSAKTWRFACSPYPENDEGKNGYWTVDHTGEVQAFGDCEVYAASGSNPWNWFRDIVVSIRPTATGKGYYLLDRSGRVVAYGDAEHQGDNAGSNHRDFVGIAVDPVTGGYWLLRMNGEVYPYPSTSGPTDHGDATGDVDPYVEFEPGKSYPPGKVVAYEIESHPTTSGYWILLTDGTVIAKNLTNHGSATIAVPPMAPTEWFAAIRRTSTGNGYWIVSGSGLVYGFGDAQEFGNAARGWPKDQWYWGLVWDLIPNWATDDGYLLMRANGLIEAFGDATDVGIDAYTGRPSLPYPFFNLMQSDYNIGNIQFTNPIWNSRPSAPAQYEAKYWDVPFDLLTNDELKKYDFLIWSPEEPNFDLTRYLPKIRYFTQELGRTLLIDAGTTGPILGLDVTFSCAWSAPYALVASPGPQTNVDATTITVPEEAQDDPLFEALESLGGWSFNDGSGDEYASIHPALVGDDYYWSLTDSPRISCITEKSGSWETLITAEQDAATDRDVMLIRRYSSGGALIVSTLGLPHEYNCIWDEASGANLYHNRGNTAYLYTDDSDTYRERVSSYAVEGMAKLLYNMAVMSSRPTLADNADEYVYTSKFSVYSPWKQSWVINNENGVLANEEVAAHNFIEAPISSSDPTVKWQRLLSDKTLKELIEVEMSEDDLVRNKAALIQYAIEVSNPLVETPDELGPDSKPYAWTDAYTPGFTVPPDFGPHIIDEEPSYGEYEAAQFIHRDYPSKPYGVRVDAHAADTAQYLNEQTVTYSLTGTGRESTTSTSVVDWAHDSTRRTKHWVNYLQPDYGLRYPYGIDVYTYSNYFAGRNNWCNLGIYDYLFYGSVGETVKFVQQFLNIMLYWGWYSAPYSYLTLDGIYGSKTTASVKAFQQQRQLHSQTGTIDAETWAAIGAQCLRLEQFVYAVHGKYLPYPPAEWWFERFFLEARKRMNRYNISDGDDTTTFQLRSDSVNGPANISNALQVSLGAAQYIVGITIVPWTEGAANTIKLDAIDAFVASRQPQWNWANGGAMHIRAMGPDGITPTGLPGSGFNLWLSRYPQGGRRIENGRSYFIPFGPVYADTVIVSIAQDQPSGWGTARVMGVRDIKIHTRSSSSRTVDITCSGTARVKAGEDTIVTLRPALAGSSASGSITGVRWTQAVINGDVLDEYGPTPGRGVGNVGDVYVEWWSEPSKLLLRDNEVQNLQGISTVSGPVLGNLRASSIGTISESAPSVWYSKTEDGKISPMPESGWVSKTDGIKLLCDRDGNPIGFPSLNFDIGPWEYQRHYMNYTVSNLDNDPSIKVGFYDAAQQEFITVNGAPKMSYIEYLSRGPQNIYIAVMSDYERETLQPYPDNSDAPLIPFKWAYPVYGVCVTPGSRIHIAPLPDNLGPNDLWPVPVKTGTFTRDVTIPVNHKLPVDGWLSQYAGKTLKAFYSVPEAELGGWSPIYGKPYIDVKGEHPIVLTDNTIQVRQAPILMVEQPTIYDSLADPVRPIVTVYTRETPTGAWTTLTYADIADVEVSTGEIRLLTPLVSTDPNYVKVDYTTARATYNFTHYLTEKINLNPYPGFVARDWIGKPIYVYILPEFVQSDPDVSFPESQEKYTIPESRQTRTLRFTMDKSIWDQFSPNYNPLAVQLGIIFVTSALDVSDLTIIDTRRRGGGAYDAARLAELERITNEAASYWDFEAGTGMSYQNGGFIIIRLPQSLKLQFPVKSQIEEVIKRNITAGVEFKIETLEGKEW